MRLRTLIVSLATAALIALGGEARAEVTDLFFTEYIEGSSNNKALEIHNPTGAAVNLSAGGYSIQMFFNGNPAAGLTINLTGTVAAGDVYVLAHGSADPAILAQADQTSGAGFFNGDDAIVLRKGTTVIDSLGQAGFDPGTEWGSGLVSTADNTLRRSSCVADANVTDVFDPSAEWAGFANNTFDGLGAFSGCGTPPPPPPPPDPVVAAIYEIQGSGTGSPLAGQLVITQGNVVTAVDSNGFFMQSIAGDGDAATSDGIFVFTSTAPTVSVGQTVDVAGRVAEFFDFTEITSPTITILGTDPLPESVQLDTFAPLAEVDWERFEGMLVRVEAGTIAAGSNSFGDFPAVARTARPFREPGISGGIEPAIFEVDPDALGLPDLDANGGSTFSGAGVLAFAFGDYQLWPTSLTVDNVPLPRPVSAREPGEFTVATQNVLRFFDTLNPNRLSPAAYELKLTALASHIGAVLGLPDVLVLQEVENLTVLEDLAARLGNGYTAHLLEGNDIGGIDVGFLVRDTIEVQSVTQMGALDTWVFDGAVDLLNDRPPLVLDGVYVGNGAPFPITVVGVHQRSMIDVETLARVRAKRLEQATRLAGYVNELLAADPSRRIIVAGDFNAFEFDDGYADVMGTLAALAPLSNLLFTLPAEERYSYIHEALAQAIDHALVTPSVGPFVRGFEYARGNADAPEGQGVSDHDGAVVFLMSDRDADGLPDDGDACVQSDTRATVVLGACDSGAPNLVLEPGCTLADRIGTLRASALNHGEFVSAVAHLLGSLKKDGLLTGGETGAIQSCAAKAN